MRAQRAGPRTRLRAWLLWAGALAAGSAAAVEVPPAAAPPPPPRPAIAVLPLRLHSAGPIDRLGESLSQLIRSRLEQSGELRVLDAGAAAPERDPELREAAQRLGADYVVSGSVTELAGRYSLDIRVTPASPGLRSQTWVLTADTEDELGGRIDELAGRILEQVRGAQPARVASVEIAGAPGLEAELLDRLRSAVGAPYDAEQVERDVADLRADPRVASASVETGQGPDGVALRFQVALVPERPPSAPVSASEGEVVAEVRIRGERRIEAEAIRLRIGTREGEPLSHAQLASDVRAVYGLGFFRNVSVYTEADARGLIVVFEVEENPVVREISISGNDKIDAEKIRDILTITTGSSLDYPLLFENRQRIESLYRAEGYYLAKVSSDVESIGEAAVAVNFHVEEGEKLKLRSIEFEGNEFFTNRELTEGFQTKTWKFWSYATSWFDKSGTYSEPLFIQDLRSVEKKYTDAGFLQVQIGEPDVVASAEGLTVSVPIAEGRRFRVGAIDITGDATVDVERLREKLALAKDEYFDRSHLTEDVDRLEEHYTDRGFYFASVTPLPSLSEESDVADVTFQVRKGPLYFVRQIDISGNTTTIDPVIRREIPIVEGQLYSRRQILLSESRVKATGFFEEVELRPEPTEEPDQLDLQVKLVERPTGSFSFGAGFSSQDNFVVTGSLSQTNLFGRGYGANISADLGGSTQRFFISLQDPAFLGSTFGVGTTVFRTNLRYEDFEQQQIGASVVVGHALSEDGRTRGSLRYQFAERQTDDDSNFQAAGVILRDVLVNTWSSSGLELAVTSDTRNDRFAPNEGHSLGASLEAAGLGFDSQFARAEAGGAYYLGAPKWLLDHSTFVVSGRAGYAFPFNDIGDWNLPGVDPFVTLADPTNNIRPLDQIDDDQTLPLSERYFLGGLGAFQLRGYKARSVGPRRTVLEVPVRFFNGVPVTDPLGIPLIVPGAFVPLFRVAEVDASGNTVIATPCDSNPLNPPDQLDDVCNDIDDKDEGDFADLHATDVIGGNKFFTSSFEYRFPISETIGLQGVAFFDLGNAFAEGDTLFQIDDWRYGTGVGLQWFSPFGPLAVVLGFPLDPNEVEDSPVFEFSVGGAGF